MFNFEKLETWQEAIAFAGQVYDLTSNFPPDERFGLTNQMRRAAVSISSNLAEGSSLGRISPALLRLHPDRFLKWFPNPSLVDGRDS